MAIKLRTEYWWTYADIGRELGFDRVTIRTWLDQWLKDAKAS